MALQDFIKIERDVADGGVIILLIHRVQPYFTVEMTPRYGKDGSIRGGVIRRIKLGNSPTGGYHRYSPLIAEAERFFDHSLLEEQGVVPGNRRL